MRLNEVQPFASPEEALKHAGVKGMKWGVRKEEDEIVGSGPTPIPIPLADRVKHNEDTKEYISATTKIRSQTITPAQAKAALAENHQKAAAKLAPSEAKGKSVKDRWNNLSSTQKKAIFYGVGAAAVVGFSVYSQQNLKKYSIPGAVTKPGIYNRLVGDSQMRTWMGQGHVTKSSFARQAFELPAGHTFHRLSTAAEQGFGNVTYSTHSLDDLNRYSVGFRAAGGALRPPGAPGATPAGELFHVAFKSTEKVRVPNLTEVLNTMRESMEDARKAKGITSAVTHQDALKTYNNLSGSWWDTSDAVGLISKLKAKGYGAIVDEMDAGVRADSPLVFFGNATAKTSKKLTRSDFKTFEKGLKEVTGRK